MMTHYWRIKKWLPDRFGQRCRVIATGRMNSVFLEFEDGFRVISCRYFIRKLPTNNSQ